jgi:thiol-disulfide isomerase/thioredoxin
MRVKFLLLFLILIITIYVFIEEEKESFKEKKVIKKKSKKKDIKLVLYWANWCGVCQKIKPNWNKAKEILVKKYPKLNIEEIDCDKSKSYILVNGEKESLEGVPTILLRDGVNDIEYERGEELKGDRSVEDLIKFYEINM